MEGERGLREGEGGMGVYFTRRLVIWGRWEDGGGGGVCLRRESMVMDEGVQTR